ncbi:alpha-L-rhamnosidase C-terminal domain-containing protein [Streptomyces scopuliridis]
MGQTYGRAASAWEPRPDGLVALRVTIPPGTRAQIELGSVRTEVGSGEHALTAALEPATSR